MIMSFSPLNQLMILTISIIAEVNLSEMQQNMLSIILINHCVDTSRQDRKHSLNCGNIVQMLHNMRRPTVTF